ncbi:MAG: universal stress protein, partial [Desulfobacteraceae bacterium]|nr:universal stress protein [Desulfobacteraceae bacterium]
IAAHQVLEKAKCWIPEMEVQTSIRIGSEFDGIFEELNRGTYDLIILKARQAGQFKDFIRTKLGRRVARYSPISVLVVKRTHTKLNRILICTSGQEIAEQVIELGARLTQVAQAHATLLYVTDPVPSMYTGLTKMEETLPDMLQTATPVAKNLHQGVKILTHYQVDADLELRHGSVPDEILREAHLGDYDLIVLGASKASTELTGRLLGNVAKHIVDKAQCPVLVVRKPGTLT